MGETSTSRLLISKLLLNNFNLKPNSECPVAKMLVVTKPISTSATTSPTYKKAYSIHTNQAFITTTVIQLIDKTTQLQFSLNMKNKRPRKTIGDAKYYHSTSFEILLHIMREVRHFSRIFLLLFLPVGEQMIQSLQYESQHDRLGKPPPPRLHCGPQPVWRREVVAGEPGHHHSHSSQAVEDRLCSGVVKAKIGRVSGISQTCG